MTRLTAEQINAAAHCLVQARQSKQPARLSDDFRPRSASDAYAIQDAVNERLWPDNRITSWKVGAPDTKTEPNTSPIANALLLSDGAELNSDDFFMLGIEGELAFRLGKDFPPRLAKTYQREQVMEAIASVHPTIEVVDTRLPDWENADPLWKLADFQNNGALIVGPEISDWQDIDPLTLPAQLWIDGALKLETCGANKAQDLLRLVTWTVNHCAKRCGGLKAGDIITTGTFTGLEYVQPGAQVMVRFPDVGEVGVRFSL